MPDILINRLNPYAIKEARQEAYYVTQDNQIQPFSTPTSSTTTTSFTASTYVVNSSILPFIQGLPGLTPSTSSGSDCCGAIYALIDFYKQFGYDYSNWSLSGGPITQTPLGYAATTIPSGPCITWKELSGMAGYSYGPSLSTYAPMGMPSAGEKYMEMIGLPKSLREEMHNVASTATAYSNYVGNVWHCREGMAPYGFTCENVPNGCDYCRKAREYLDYLQRVKEEWIDSGKIQEIISNDITTGAQNIVNQYNAENCGNEYPAFNSLYPPLTSDITRWVMFNIKSHFNDLYTEVNNAVIMCRSYAPGCYATSSTSASSTSSTIAESSTSSTAAPPTPMIMWSRWVPAENADTSAYYNFGDVTIYNGGLSGVKLLACLESGPAPAYIWLANHAIWDKVSPGQCAYVSISNPPRDIIFNQYFAWVQYTEPGTYRWKLCYDAGGIKDCRGVTVSVSGNSVKAPNPIWVTTEYNSSTFFHNNSTVGVGGAQESYVVTNSTIIPPPTQELPLVQLGGFAPSSLPPQEQNIVSGVVEESGVKVNKTQWVEVGIGLAIAIAVISLLVMR